MGHGAVAAEGEFDVPERLIRLVVRPLHLFAEGLGFAVAAGEDGLAHLG